MPHDNPMLETLRNNISAFVILTWTTAEDSVQRRFHRLTQSVTSIAAHATKSPL